jgi:hypothetical protein
MYKIIEVHSINKGKVHSINKGKVDSINKSKVHSINKGKVIGIPLLLSTLFQLNHGCQLYWRTTQQHGPFL